jgi:hypothetical protein
MNILACWSGGEMLITIIETPPPPRLGVIPDYSHGTVLSLEEATASHSLHNPLYLSSCSYSHMCIWKCAGSAVLLLSHNFIAHIIIFSDPCNLFGSGFSFFHFLFSFNVIFQVMPAILGFNVSLLEIFWLQRVWPKGPIWAVDLSPKIFLVLDLNSSRYLNLRYFCVFC